jgi:hypothetical protein
MGVKTAFFISVEYKNSQAALRADLTEIVDKP